MKGHKNFLKVDFVIQTLLIGSIILDVFFTLDFFNQEKGIEIFVPFLIIWLILASTFEKIKYGNDLRFKINRVWIIVFLIGLVFFIEKIFDTPIVFLIFLIFSILVFFANYSLVIYEFFNLIKEPIPNDFEDILDDNDF